MFDAEAEARNPRLYDQQDSDDLVNLDINFSNKELNEIENVVNGLEFAQKINLNSNDTENNETLLCEINDEAFYDLTKGTPLESFTIKLGSDELPRFSCANHKLNLAVRHAIENHNELVNILQVLNKSNSHIRRSIQLNRIFRLEKCRLRLENLTRWSSAYLMLESVKKAYGKSVFNEDMPCPVELDQIEIYLQILKPTYLLSISFQNMKSSIADTIPSNICFDIRIFLMKLNHRHQKVFLTYWKLIKK